MVLWEGLRGMLAGIGLMLFGGLMLRVAGYGVMEPIYTGLVWLGFIVLIAAPLYYWGGALLQRVRDASSDASDL